jgi:beta-lactamase superfamily II metal-dependent hydrolase
MEISVFDVEHGSCAAVISPTGRLLMIDCGHNASTGWRPSAWVVARRQPIDNLTITNFDEDHVTDLPHLLQRTQIKSFTVNWSVTPDWVRRTKGAFGTGPGIRALVDMMTTRPGVGVDIDWGRDSGFQLERFWHPLTRFQDENSLSVVTFVHYEGVRIVFPGDLTREAWRAFLPNSDFRKWLAATKIFVASHHGREDGYCPEVFEYCKPSVIVVSDKSIMHDTQLVDYSRHASGILWNRSEKRCCLTTRNDGTLRITAVAPGGFFVQASR